MLEQLEDALLEVYAQDREMFDADALSAVTHLIRHYSAETFPDSPFPLSAWAFVAHEALREICDQAMGRDLNYDPADLAQLMVEPIKSEGVVSAETTIATLNQLRQSIEHWQQTGLRGYGEFLHHNRHEEPD